MNIFSFLPLGPSSTITSLSDVTVFLLQYTCDESESKRRNATERKQKNIYCFIL